jgi:antitoxin component YwqK of YwqJK toxin-antitoxin module
MKRSRKQITYFLLAVLTVACRHSPGFASHITEYYEDGKIYRQADTITGYNKLWYENGRLMEEGKITKSKPEDYRDSVWKYYNQNGLLVKQETYNKEGKLNSTAFTYFFNELTSETYQYFEGDWKDKSNFKFHEIRKDYWPSGKLMSLTHKVNGVIVEQKQWTKKGDTVFLKPLLRPQQRPQ